MPRERGLPFEKDDSRLRILYLYRMLRDHTDESHTLSTREIQQRMTAEHGITMHRTMEHDCIVLQTSHGVIKRRPLGELQRIWNELNRLSAVHVDGVLNGSGSSRNQPETILANLPYIEWLYLDGKKHISYVGKNTHAYGTLKKMDTIAARMIEKEIQQESSLTRITIIIVTSDIVTTVETLQTAFDGAISTIEQGVYFYESMSLRALIVITSHTSLLPGTYVIVPPSGTPTGRLISLNGTDYYVVENDTLRLLIPSKTDAGSI